MAIDTVVWSNGRVRILDQTRLPGEVSYRDCSDWSEVADAIRAMQVRGAPAIGVAAAFGLCLAAGGDESAFDAAAHGLAATRPTAVNLFWAIERMRRARREAGAAGFPDLQGALLATAQAILAEDRAMGEAIGRHGAPLVPARATVLTHCNAGCLATGGTGTALAVVLAAHRAGKEVRVLADETRPLLQGARLTAWELQREGVPVEVVCDGAAGGIMARGEVQLVIVGADRVAANGDVANKVGTYPLAVVAKRHGIPFYVAAPVSTLDPATPDGGAIPIEERDPREVTHGPSAAFAALTPEGVGVRNPAFDITPHDLVTAIVTDRGVSRPPYADSLREAVADGKPRGA